MFYLQQAVSFSSIATTPDRHLLGKIMRTPIPTSIEQMFANVNICLSLADARAEDIPLCYVNDKFCSMTGYDREELIGRNCRLLQGPDSEPISRQEIRSVLDNPKQVENQVFITNYRKSGERFENYLYIFRLINRDGETDFFLGSQFDVTKAKQAQGPDKHARQLWNGIKMIDNPYMETARMVLQSANLMSVSAANIARARLAASAQH